MERRQLCILKSTLLKKLCLWVQLLEQVRNYEMSALLFTDHLLLDSVSKAVDEISKVCFNLTVLTWHNWLGSEHKAYSLPSSYHSEQVMPRDAVCTAELPLCIITQYGWLCEVKLHDKNTLWVALNVHDRFIWFIHFCLIWRKNRNVYWANEPRGWIIMTKKVHIVDSFTNSCLKTQKCSFISVKSYPVDAALINLSIHWK